MTNPFYAIEHEICHRYLQVHCCGIVSPLHDPYCIIHWKHLFYAAAMLFNRSHYSVHVNSSINTYFFPKIACEHLQDFCSNIVGILVAAANMALSQ